MTVLKRAGGSWDIKQVSALSRGLSASVRQNPLHPEYLILLGHYAEERVRGVFVGGVTYTVTQVTGIQDGTLPFIPSL